MIKTGCLAKSKKADCIFVQHETIEASVRTLSEEILLSKTPFNFYSRSRIIFLQKRIRLFSVDCSQMLAARRLQNCALLMHCWICLAKTHLLPPVSCVQVSLTFSFTLSGQNWLYWEVSSVNLPFTILPSPSHRQYCIQSADTYGPGMKYDQDSFFLAESNIREWLIHWFLNNNALPFAMSLFKHSS